MLFVLGVAGTILALLVLSALRRRVRTEPGSPARPVSAFALLAAVVFAAVAFFEAVTVIPAGNVGVVDFFGTVSPATLKAGINLVNPLARVVKFSVKTQELKEVMDVPSKEGLTVQLELSALFHLNPEKAAGGLQDDRPGVHAHRPRPAVPVGRAGRHGFVRREGALHLGARAARPDDPEGRCRRSWSRVASRSSRRRSGRSASPPA